MCHLCVCSLPPSPHSTAADAMESRTYHNVGLDACRSVRACGAGLFVTADATATSDRFGRECVCVCVHMCVCVRACVCVCVLLHISFCH